MKRLFARLAIALFILSGTAHAATLEADGRITGVATPTGANDGANKTYVDAAIQGLDVKGAAVALCASNIASLSGPVTCDGVLSVTGNRLLLTGQSTASQNGPWITAVLGWTRPADFSTGSNADNAFMFVQQGTLYGGTGWTCTTAAPNAIVDTNNLTFAQFSGGGTYTAGAGLNITGTQFFVPSAGITNAMLAGSIAASKLVGTDITTVGTITAGVWNGTAIANANLANGAVANLTGANSGDASIAAFGSAPTANGATISGQAITLQPADATHPGLVSAAAQAFGGTKTFDALVSTALTGGGTGVALTIAGNTVDANRTVNVNSDLNFNSTNLDVIAADGGAYYGRKLTMDSWASGSHGLDGILIIAPQGQAGSGGGASGDGGTVYVLGGGPGPLGTGATYGNSGGVVIDVLDLINTGSGPAGPAIGDYGVSIAARNAKTLILGNANTNITINGNITNVGVSGNGNYSIGTSSHYLASVYMGFTSYLDLTTGGGWTPPSQAAGQAAFWYDSTSDTMRYYNHAAATQSFKGVNTGDQNETHGFTIDGGGNVITTGVKGYWVASNNFTITSVTLEADQTCSAVVDVWKKAYATSSPPLVANTITASALPTLSSAQSSQDTTLTGWTTTVSAGDVFAYNVNSATTCTRVQLFLKMVPR